MKKNFNNQAFTLIEMSIVLVIVGLIVAGVLIGQDLIRGSEARGMITQLDRFSAGINSFKGKFSSLPGDFSQASSYISATATNGNGDGYIADNAAIGGAAVPAVIAATSEYQGVWNHLSALNLVDGSFSGTTFVTLGTTFPYTKAQRGGVLFFGFSDNINYYYLGLGDGAGTTSFLSQNIITPDVALAIDTKVDDGLPGTGTVQARGTTTLNGAATLGATPGLAGGNCTQGGSVATAKYDTASGALLLCQLRVRQ